MVHNVKIRLKILKFYVLIHFWYHPRILFVKGDIIRIIIAAIAPTASCFLMKSKFSGLFLILTIFYVGYERFDAILFHLLNIILNYAID